METMTVAQLVIEAIVDIVKQYGVTNCILAIMITPIVYGGYYLRKKKKLNLFRTIVVAFTIMYGAYIVELTFLTREPGSRIESNLRFFGTYGADALAQSFMVENLIMLIPLGVLLALLFKKMRRIGWCFLISLAVTGAIEGIQFLTQRGYFQVDDLWLNVLGALIGYCLALFVAWGVSRN